MKIKLLLLFFLSLNTLLFCQTDENIKILYEGIITPNEENISNSVKGNLDAKNAILSEMLKTKHYALIANKNESIFEEIDKIDNKQTNNNVKFGDNKGLQFYRNIKDSMFYEQVDLHKLFLVKTKLTPIKWIQNREYKNDKLKSAYYIDTTNNTKVSAFYSTELFYKTGPDKFWGLPGVILELNIEFHDKESIIKSFSFKSVNIELESKTKLELPKGKIIDKQQYKAIIEKIKEGNSI